jgi:hypothetical protein
MALLLDNPHTASADGHRTRDLKGRSNGSISKEVH